MKTHKRKLSSLHMILHATLPDRCPCCDKLIRGNNLYCEKCLKNFPSITYRTNAKGGFPCVSAVPYKDSYAEAVKRFKFSNRRQYGYALAHTMAKAIATVYCNERFDLITYVPMHRLKEKERGYNQSRILAKKLSSILQIPVVTTLEKIRNNEPQHTVKTRAQREQNVKGAFKVIDKETVCGKNILLIDDIITTGFTLGECARVLDKCKTEKILCATFAVTVAKTT